MDPEDLEREIREIHALGYGGVEIVSLQPGPADPLTDEAETAWGSLRWKSMVDLIARTTEELGMSMDLANGPAWPIAMPQITDPDDPAALIELTYGEIRLQDGCYEGPVPERQKKHYKEAADGTLQEVGTPELIACMAYQLALQDTDARILKQDTYVDLMPQVRDGRIRVELPGENWILFAFYQQPAAHRVKGSYVIDHFSQVGAQACIDYWDPIFKENPQPSLESLFCDSLEYDVEMEWSRGMAEEFKARN